MSYFKGTNIYFIKEEIYSKSGLPSIANTIGPTCIQVVKTVYHLMREKEAFYKGKALYYDNIGLWDKFKVAFGIDISERDKPNGKLVFSLEYCGFSNFITPLDGFDRIIPKWFSSKHSVRVPSPYRFGRDPVSNINLYRDLKTKFFIDKDGDGVPVSLAKYNSKKHEISYIYTEKEFSEAMRKLQSIKT